MMTRIDMQGGMVPGRAHNPAFAGSIPAPATNPTPQGRRRSGDQCPASVAGSSRGTDTATGAQRGTRDSRERPATLLPPAAVHPTLPPPLSTVAGGVSVCCDGGLV